jgi:hypothetical protein
MTRLLSEIAAEIKADWTSLDRRAAKPYVDAMSKLSSLGDQYHLDSAVSVVSYFLANCQTWRGNAARRIKAELRGMLKRYS